MATVTATRTRGAGRNAQHSATKTQTPTAQQSLTVMRNVLGATIGSITYLRNLFPDENYRDTRLNGLQLKTLVPSQTPEADRLIEWIDRGCCDALQKQYLKSMVFGIYLDESQPDRLAESYTFSFSYPDKDRWSFSLTTDGKQQFSFKTRDDVTRATCEMLRRLLILTQTLEPLPENAFLTMRLYYYDDVTPPSYEPPLFRAGEDTMMDIEGDNPLEVELGNVGSPYHALSLRVLAASGPSCTQAKENQQQDQVRQVEEPSSKLDQVTSVLGQLEINNVIAVSNELQTATSQAPEATLSLQHPVSIGGTQDLIDALKENNLSHQQSNASMLRNPIRPMSTVADSDESKQSGDKVMAVSLTNNSNAMAAFANTQPLSPHPSRRANRHEPSIEQTPCASENGDLSMSLIMESGERLTRGRISAILSSQVSMSRDIVAANANAGSGVMSPASEIGKSNSVSSFNDAKEEVSSSLQFGESQAPVVCPCGIDDAEPPMVACSLCKTLAHAACLGCFDGEIYADASLNESMSDTSRHSSSAKRICDECSLRSGMRTKSGMTPRLALTRRALARLWNRGVVHGVKSLAGVIGTNFGTTRTIVRWLTDDGFFTPVQPAQVHKLAKCHRARELQIVKNAFTIAKFENFFPGLAAVSDFSDQKDGSSVGGKKRSRKSVSVMMPLPDPTTDSLEMQTDNLQPQVSISGSISNLTHLPAQQPKPAPPSSMADRTHAAKKRKVSVVERDIAAL